MNKKIVTSVLTLFSVTVFCAEESMLDIQDVIRYKNEQIELDFEGRVKYLMTVFAVQDSKDDAITQSKALTLLKKEGTESKLLKLFKQGIINSSEANMRQVEEFISREIKELSCKLQLAETVLESTEKREELLDRLRKIGGQDQQIRTIEQAELNIISWEDDKTKAMDKIRELIESD